MASPVDPGTAVAEQAAEIVRLASPCYPAPGHLRNIGVVFMTTSTTPPGAQQGTAPLLESGTRERVLQAVSERGPLTAATLAAEFGLTATAVRRHLDNLLETGLIESHESSSATRGRGRPARSFVVSDAGHQALDSDYDLLAVESLRFLAAHAGPDAVAAFAAERMADLQSRYAAELDAAGTSPRARADALVTALTRDGFAASARPVGERGSRRALTGIQLCQGHCPVQDVAREFPQFCDAETEAFSQLLGVHVQRLATLAQGDHVCTTFIPADALTAAGRTGRVPTTRPDPTGPPTAFPSTDQQTSTTPSMTETTTTTERSPR